MVAPLIYLAAPYTHRSPEVMLERAALIQEATELLLADGFAVFSPITYGTQMEHRIGHKFEDWKHLNDAIIRAASHFWVLKLNGWNESRGVRYEEELWHSLSVTGANAINYLTMEDIRNDDTRHNLPGRKG